jgi:hypothetical protein
MLDIISISEQLKVFTLALSLSVAGGKGGALIEYLPLPNQMVEDALVVSWALFSRSVGFAVISSEYC